MSGRKALVAARGCTVEQRTALLEHARTHGYEVIDVLESSQGGALPSAVERARQVGADTIVAGDWVRTRRAVDLVKVVGSGVDIFVAGTSQPLSVEFAVRTPHGPDGPIFYKVPARTVTPGDVTADGQTVQDAVNHGDMVIMHVGPDGEDARAPKPDTLIDLAFFPPRRKNKELHPTDEETE